MGLETFTKELSRTTSNMGKVSKYSNQVNDLKGFLMKEYSKKAGFMEQTAVSSK